MTIPPAKLGLTISCYPHIHSRQHTRQIMLDVILALLPSLILATGLMGMRALLVALVSVLCCMGFEAAFCAIRRKPIPLSDCSAIVTGMLLSFCFKSNIPLWQVVLGAFIAIVPVKQLFGGLGNNFLNPAMTASFAIAQLRRYILPLFAAPAAAVPAAADALSSATPLAQMKQGLLPDVPLSGMLLHKLGGSIGEISSLLLLLGGLYLLLRNVIKPRIPLAYLGTVGLLSLLFSPVPDRFTWMLYSLLSGSLLLGAIFIATDYASSPVTPRGQWLYGIGCGLLNVLLRAFGPGVEGVTYAILIMNLLARPLDRLGAPRRYGGKAL